MWVALNIESFLQLAYRDNFLHVVWATTLANQSGCFGNFPRSFPSGSALCLDEDLIALAMLHDRIATLLCDVFDGWR